MCGIAGEINWHKPPNSSAVAKMTDALVHRGPDASGHESTGPISFGHRRLSIIDLSPDANQPMSIADGELMITYNGEIYNFMAIRALLETKGYRFRTNSDTEVILFAYKEWGDACVEKMNGMFAFAIWDRKAQRVFLARDRLGKKPLFYSILNDNGVIFASEIQALRLHPEAPSNIAIDAFGHFLATGYTPTERSILAGVEKLPPAHTMVIESGQAPKITSYWDLAPHFIDKRTFRTKNDAVQELAFLLSDAVQIRQISDVPLGAFLSGGIDSSIVAEAMKAQSPDHQNRTFSIGFEQESYNELPHARHVAKHLKLDHLDEIIMPDILSDLPKIIVSMGEPFSDTSMVPFYYLSQMARQHVTVALSGDGSDEIFAGYPTYLADRLRAQTSWLPSPLIKLASAILDHTLPVSHNKVSFDYKLRQFLSGHSLDAARAHFHWRTIFSDGEQQNLVAKTLKGELAAHDPFAFSAKHFNAVSSCDFIDQGMYVDIKTWLVEDILVKVDRTTMAHSLESRSPFLDYRLVEFAASLPVSWKLNGKQGKHILVESGRGRLPDRVFNRKKAGFNAPVSHWLNGPLRDIGQDMTKSEKMASWFDLRYVDKLWNEHVAGRRDNGLRLFNLLCFGLWLENSS